MKLAAIVNPIAGNGQGKKTGEVLKKLLNAAGIDCSFYYTERPAHATELTKQALAEGADTVLSVGGDGTAFEVACGLMYTERAMGIIPAGTGNDFIKSLDLPVDTKAALDIVLNRAPRHVDAGAVNEKYFINVCGAGFDVTVLDYAEPIKKYFKGIIPYFVGLIRTVLTYKPTYVTLIADGKELFSKNILVCAVANGKYIGGGMPIAPMAVPDDGVFEVMVVEHVSRPRIVTCLPAFLKGKLQELSVTTHLQAREVTMHGRNMRVQIDGEIFPMEEANFRLLKDALLLHW